MVRPCHEVLPLMLVAVYLAAVGAAGHGGGTRPTVVGLESRRCPSDLCFVLETSATRARCGTREDKQSATFRQCSEFTSQPARGKRVVAGAEWRWAGGARWRRPVASCSSHATSAGSHSGSRVAPEDGAVVSTGTVQGGCHWHVDGSSSSSSRDEAACPNGDAPFSGRNAGERRRRRGLLARGIAATEKFFASDDDNSSSSRRSRNGERAAQGEQGRQGGAGEPEEGLRVPRHVAFVMDGNGRWAADRKMPRSAGHAEGARRAREAVEACRELGVEFVTLYAFSTENWSRPAVEVSFLMKLMEKTLLEQRDELRRNGIRLAAIGELDRLPLQLRSLLEEIQEESFTERGGGGPTGSTASRSIGETVSPAEGPPGTIPVIGAGGTRVASRQNGSGLETRGGGGGVDAVVKDGEVNGRHITQSPETMTLCLAISYGGRAEVAAAARELAEEVAAGRMDPGDIDEESLERRLSTSRLGIPDPDLVVRTSGESRLSNLLLWQAAYSELCVVSKAWPEFRRPDLEEAFREFGRRRRRFGKTPEQMASQ